jgi:hypothetical protein
MEEAAFEIITPVLESAMILAAEYAKKTGRDSITSLDLEYAMKYCARYTVGKEVGSLFPEVYDESESDEDDLEIVDENLEENRFRRYEGDDPFMTGVNAAFDTWDEWTPTNLVEQLLKASIELKKNN